MNETMISELQRLFYDHIIDDATAVEANEYLYNGVPAPLIRYYLQCKEGKEYLQSDMTKNLIFYMPYNECAAFQMSNNINDRFNVTQTIRNAMLADNSNRHIKKDPFKSVEVNFEATDEICDVIDCIGANENLEEIAAALRNIADCYKEQIEKIEGRAFDVVLGVVHGEQVINDEALRTPHIHFLLIRCKQSQKKSDKQ